MSAAPRRALLADGRRRHFQHGPIDLVLEAWGAPGEVEAAHAQAWARFEGLLEELVAELPALRAPAGSAALAGPTARRMAAACAPHAGVFVTPMAAVAGAVADEVLAAMVAGRELAKAYVNDGGDIALHLAPGESLTGGIVALAGRPEAAGLARLSADSPVRGIATSGWRGRSWSFGIADAVTVLAATAASADVAATLIANEVTCEHPAITRQPAAEVDDNTDLGHRPVTTAVGALDPGSVAAALDRGARCAAAMHEAGHIIAAMLVLRARRRIVGEARALIARTAGEGSDG